jgi:tRNA 2-thiouridine synthesizing protein E
LQGFFNTQANQKIAMSESTDHLQGLPHWSVDSAQSLAQAEGICIDNNHIQILIVARDFFANYGFSPSMRPLCKVVATSLGPEKGRSLYLNQLFPGSPAKLVAKLAGLPKPKDCI